MLTYCEVFDVQLQLLLQLCKQLRVKQFQLLKIRSICSILNKGHLGHSYFIRTASTLNELVYMLFSDTKLNF